MRGPQRKPTAHLQLAGSWRGVERAKTEPNMGYALPDPPPNTSESALQYWPYLCDVIANLRCSTVVDGLQVAIMAEALAEIDQCDKLIDTYGELLEKKNGDYYNNPAIQRRASAFARLQSCLDRFGMNPSNRSKVAELAPKLAEVVDVAPKKTSRYEDR